MTWASTDFGNEEYRRITRRAKSRVLIFKSAGAIVWVAACGIFYLKLETRNQKLERGIRNKENPLPQRIVLAGYDFVSALGMTDAGGVADLNARVLAAIDARDGGFFGNRGRQGENGGLRLPDRVPDRAGAGEKEGGLRWV